MDKFLFLFFLCGLSFLCSAQNTVSDIAEKVFNQTIQAYPRLKNADIRLRYTQRGSAMAASYTWWSIFLKPENRVYRVKINSNVSGAYNCFQFAVLSDSARKGVMGHEIGHIDYFHRLNFFGFVKFIIHQALPGGLKKSERATDIRAIEHGLGHELRAWSAETRTCFLQRAGRRINSKFGNRYLKPTEIDSVMQTLFYLYK